jgi:4-alpha-glucanotransferase
MMRLNKNAGLLMHVTSLPSPYGVGDMRAATEYLLPFLKETEQYFWQILPLHPVGYGESPYQSFSAFAGNESWISPDELLEEGLITPEQIKHKPDFQKDFWNSTQ